MPEGWVMPIHKAQADVSTSASPARRMPQAPLLEARNRKNNQGPRASEAVVPKANKAITPAPSTALADNDANNKAEYSSPQGMSAQAAPSTAGACSRWRPIQGRVLRQTDWPTRSTQAGWRACQSKAAPMKKTTT